MLPCCLATLLPYYLASCPNHTQAAYSYCSHIPPSNLPLSGPLPTAPDPVPALRNPALEPQNRKHPALPSSHHPAPPNSKHPGLPNSRPLELPPFQDNRSRLPGRQSSHLATTPVQSMCTLNPPPPLPHATSKGKRHHTAIYSQRGQSEVRELKKQVGYKAEKPTILFEKSGN